MAALDKYIEHHKLGADQYKTEKVQAIKRHIATTIVLGDDKDQSSELMMILSSQHVIVPHLSPVMVVMIMMLVMRTFPLAHRSSESEYVPAASSRRRTVKRPDKFKDYYM